MDTPFALQQRQIARIIAKAVLAASDDIVDIVSHGAGTNTERALRLAQLELRKELARQQVSERIRPLLERTVKKGAGLLGDEARRAVMRDRTMIAAIQEQTEFYADNYVKRIVGKAVERRLAKDSKADVRAMVERMATGNDAYWKSVANHATSQGYHYGMLKSAQQEDVQWAMYDATLDRRTSRLCRKIDGKRVNVTKALASMKGRKSDGDFVPWDLVSGERASVTALKQTGILVPPFHPHCRTVLQFL